ncbi:MAG: hypothetical protein ACOX5Z_13100 [Desulfobulbus sp.]|jgi:hypothetical protein
MHIITFQYNKAASALISQKKLSRDETNTRQSQKNATRRLINRYTDRFLWEDMTAVMNPPPPKEQIIPGTWQ